VDRRETALGEDPKTASVDAILQAQLAVNETWRPVRPYNPHPINVDALIGWNRDDWSIFNLFAENRKPQPGTDVSRFRDSPGQVSLIDASLWAAKQAASAGYRGYLYSFDWQAPDTGLGTVHTIDLAFLLGSPEAWATAPMLKGSNVKERDRLGRIWRAQWAAFARSGDPNVGQEVHWAPVSATTTPVTRFAGAAEHKV
jgi:para-nitrobenzyl esterase